MTRTRVTAADLPCPLLWPALHNPERARRGGYILVLPKSSSQASFSPRTRHLLAPRAPSPDSLCHYSQELCAESDLAAVDMGEKERIRGAAGHHCCLN